MDPFVESCTWNAVAYAFSHCSTTLHTGRLAPRSSCSHCGSEYALDHRDEALAYAMQFARDLDTQLADRFVGMYVNDRTLDYGPDGREAIRRLLDMGHKAGIIPNEPKPEFI